MNSLEQFDPQVALQAILDDDPEMQDVKDDLMVALQQLKDRQFTINPVTIRQQSQLSQNQFAKVIGISVNTLKSWEQGQRKPSGSAKVLLHLLAKRPELINELAMTSI